MCKFYNFCLPLHGSGSQWFFFRCFVLLISPVILNCASVQEPIEISNKREPALIPRPVSIKWRKEAFHLDAGTEIYADKALSATADYMAEFLRRSSAYTFPVNPLINKQVSNAIIVVNDNRLKSYGKEAYELLVTPERIVIAANHEKGAFYGFQTLRQLLPNEIENIQPPETVSWRVPGVEITDYPRFSWRGYMLDSSRHFQTIEEIKRVIDLLALHKINRFHWHLIDDQGWRLEVPGYPQLTEIGSFRPNANTFLNYQPADPPENYGGYYSHEEIRSLVNYAAERHITVIPEIEMPGHTLSALVSYPELSCRGKMPEELGQTWIYKDVYCAGKEETFTFLKDVLDVTMELFPSPWIHVGGDEVPKDRWQECLFCQERIKEEGLQDEEELQSYFMQRIESYLALNNRQLIGWDDIMEGGASPSAIVQTYREPKYGIKAANQGNQVIFSTHLYVYFDYNHEGTPISKTYSFEPVTAEIEPRGVDNILGIEACMWLCNVSRRYLEKTGDIMPAERIEYQTFPRLLALAEISWSPKKARNWKDFQNRLKKYRNRLDAMDVNYYPSVHME